MSRPLRAGDVLATSRLRNGHILVLSYDWGRTYILRTDGKVFRLPWSAHEWEKMGWTVLKE